MTVIALLGPARLPQFVSKQSKSVRRAAPVICEYVSELRVCTLHCVTSPAFVLIGADSPGRERQAVDYVAKSISHMMHNKSCAYMN